jgi:hypothetical protein
MIVYWIPLIVLMTCGCCAWVAVRVCGWWIRRSRRKEEKHQQELRDIDVWLEQVWKVPDPAHSPIRRGPGPMA